MKIAVVSRIYNESDIIHDFLDYYRKIATAGFYFYDDGSTDNTVEILEKESNVNHIIKGERLSPVHSHNEQRFQRRMIMDKAISELDDDDYILLLDADEFVEFNGTFEHVTDPLIHFHLFDSYITEDDKDEPWNSREMFGPEVRNISFMVKVGAYKTIIHDRTIVTKEPSEPCFRGFVRHVGKSVSVEYWENKCTHYSTSNMPSKYKQKWEQRKGKAIHTKSDFDRPLYKWNELKQNKNLWVAIQ